MYIVENYIYSIMKEGGNVAFDRTQYRYQYERERLKRVPLDLQREKYEEVKQAATAAGESVNGYIKKAIDQRLNSKE